MIKRQGRVKCFLTRPYKDISNRLESCADSEQQLMT